ncbi:hypothetical protein QJS10_CPB20g00291 [Acorus calamus]|uniref:Uncharacterized protein n=1 Tax=Acorus calamus TaxID=4465 RepID=A0AAV9CD23_ACOCL|nr:hypothetical protein QJS10_CPB20g00291 [Acorus calamus]
MGVLSNARESVFVPDGEDVVAEGRSLKVRLHDYDDPSANPKHDPTYRAAAAPMGEERIGLDGFWSVG